MHIPYRHYDEYQPVDVSRRRDAVQCDGHLRPLPRVGFPPPALGVRGNTSDRQRPSPSARSSRRIPVRDRVGPVRHGDNKVCAGRRRSLSASPGSHQPPVSGSSQSTRVPDGLYGCIQYIRVPDRSRASGVFTGIDDAV